MTFAVFVLFLLFCSQGLLNYVVFQYFDYEHTCTWGKLFQKRVVSTELYIYVCIYYCAGCLQEGSCLIYVACAYAYKNYIQLESSWGHILAFFAVFYCFVCLRPVVLCQMVLVSLDCSFSIATSASLSIYIYNTNDK